MCFDWVNLTLRFRYIQSRKSFQESNGKTKETNIDKIRLAGYSGNCALKLILNLRRINLYEKLKTSSTILITQNCARSLFGNSTLYLDKNLSRH